MSEFISYAELNDVTFSMTIKTGRRDDLVGGDLKRSQGERPNNEYESFDERVLGGGGLVDGLKQECTLRDKMKSVTFLTRLLEIVTAYLILDPDLVRRPSKSRAPAAARGIISHLEIFELGYTVSEVGKFLVSLAARRGKKALKSDPVMLKDIMGAIDNSGPIYPQLAQNNNPLHSKENIRMEDLVKIMLTSGKAGLDLAFYVLLPVLVIMMAIMKVIEARGILAMVARTVQPLLSFFGIPGTGAFAIVQMLLVSFAAPLATLTIMEKDGTSKRQLAATLAMILTLSQANVVFPMIAVGLNLGIIMLTSIVGGLAAAAATYYLFARSVDDTGHTETAFQPVQEKRHKTTTLNLMIVGGQEAVRVILDTIPMLILAIFLVNILKTTGAIALLETILTPLFHLIGFPVVAVLPLATKYLAGGTAMMGVTVNLLKEGAITTQELNRMAGFITNPCDLVGVAVLISAGQRCASVARPAIAGFLVGVLIRGVLHLLLF